MWIATASQSKEIDRRATAEFGVPATVLMERAGIAVFDIVKELLPDGGRIALLCGRGNNGGDGFVTARHALEAGFEVECLVAAREEDLSCDAKTQCDVARAQGVHPIFVDDQRWPKRLDCLHRFDLVIDALLGTGASGNVCGAVAEAIRAINLSGVAVVSVDVPSGISADTGEELGESVWALRTVTFGLPKPFLFHGIGLEHSGYWSVAEIGFPSSLLREPREAMLLNSRIVSDLLPERMRASHKGENGHVLIVGGSARYPGAAILAAKAAIRAGAGLVTVAAIPSVLNALVTVVPEAIHLPLPENNGVIAKEAAQILEGEQHRFHAALFGPGLTHDQPVLDFLEDLWPKWHVPAVIDADALNAVAHGVTLPQDPCVLTPHPGELSRLLHSSIAEVQADRFGSARAAREMFHQTVLLKGPYSIVGSPDEPLAVNCTGNPGMASAGMGDVLSGVIATLISQDLPPYCAASCGMFWHGLAGDICAQDIGGIGFTAMDVANALPQARAKLISTCCINSLSHLSSCASPGSRPRKARSD